MDDILKRIEGKIDVLDTRLDSVDVTLAKQEVSLSEHIRRTEIIEGRLEPIESYMDKTKGVLVFVAFLASISGLVTLILKVLGKF